MTSQETDRNTVQSVGTVCRIVESLHQLDGARVTELSEELDLAKSTIHRHLTTLERNEYVTKEGDTYFLGLRLLELGDYVKNRKQLYRLAGPIVEELSGETGERAQFVVEEHGYVRYVHTAAGTHAVETDSGLGKGVHMHATAGGKAILARYPAARVRALVERRGLPAFTEDTITDEATLFEELSAIRERGFSFNDDESIVGLRAVGVPICGPNDDVLGALTVAGPKHRLKGEWFEADIPDLLLGMANELELKVAYE